MLDSLQKEKARNYWFRFQKKVDTVLNYTSRIELSGTSIKIVWTNSNFEVKSYTYTIDYDSFVLESDDFERDFIEKFKKYLEGDVNGKS